LRNDADSIPRPDTAPPTVIVFNCGTTSGANPYGRVAATRSVRFATSMPMTFTSPELSRPGAARLARARNRFEVGFASRTDALAGIAR